MYILEENENEQKRYIRSHGNRMQREEWKIQQSSKAVTEQPSSGGVLAYIVTLHWDCHCRATLS